MFNTISNFRQADEHRSVLDAPCGPTPGVGPAVIAACELVEGRLAAFWAERQHEATREHAAPVALQTAIRDLVDRGGKRLRPLFVLCGHVAAGGALATPAALDAAAAVELLHTFALLHDDVMDRSRLRRGRPTAQHTLSQQRAGSADSEWFGISAAVLAGDLAFVWADELFDAVIDSGLSADRHHSARRFFTLLRTEVIAGQYLDLHTGSHPAADETDATRIALLKSARYTVTRPLQIGAALGGADPSLIEHLEAFGDAAGLAFQLRDDVLGMFGDPSQTGKSCLDDLREGKRTLLVQRALTLAADPGREVLGQALGCATLDEIDAHRCREVIAESGALASIEAEIDEYLGRAVAAAAPLGHGAADMLIELAHLAVYRTF